MQIVIDIPNRIYKIVQNRTLNITDDEILENALKNGTPLPKGHGRLIDADSMKTMKNIQSANFNAVELIRLWIDNQPTIIETDKAESEEE